MERCVFPGFWFLETLRIIKCVFSHIAIWRKKNWTEMKIWFCRCYCWEDYCSYSKLQQERCVGWTRNTVSSLSLRCLLAESSLLICQSVACLLVDNKTKIILLKANFKKGLKCWSLSFESLFFGAISKCFQ